MGVIPGSQHRTYQIVAPISTHFRPATCEEVDCAAWRNGWKTIVASNSDAALYIRSGTSGRRYVESTRYVDQAAGLAAFVFEPGQKCFAADKHVVPLERDPLFRVREFGQTTTHVRADDWADDMSTHLDKVRRNREG